MSPLEKIKQWLATVEESERKEIAFFVLSYNMDDDEYWTSDIEPILENWLSPKMSLSSIHVGRAIAFREAINFSLSSRFTEEGWKDAHKLPQFIIERHESGERKASENLVAGMKETIRRLPERIEQWKQIGSSWTAFSEKELTNETLRAWHDEEMRQSGRPR